MSRRDRSPRRPEDPVAPARRRRFGPWRIVAPIALILLTIAIFNAVGSVMKDPAGEGESGAADLQQSPTPTSTETGQTTTAAAKRPAKKRQFVVVQPGDSPSSIAEENGLTTEEFLALNPTIDPQALPTGVRVRIRKAPNTQE